MIWIFILLADDCSVSFSGESYGWFAPVNGGSGVLIVFTRYMRFLFVFCVWPRLRTVYSLATPAVTEQ